MSHEKPIHVKFSLNQAGLMIEAMHDGEWRGVDLIKLGQPCMAGEFVDKWLRDRESYNLKITREGF